MIIDPAGDDNSVLFTAAQAGVSGNSISVEFQAPSGTTTAVVAVTGDAIRATPAAKARMTIGGSLTSEGGAVAPPGALEFLDITNGRPRYSAGTSPQWLLTWFPGTGWVLAHLAGISTTWRSASDVATPDLADGWGANPGSTGTPGGTPTVTAGASSAAQVIAAVNAHPAAAALVTASASGASVGSVAAVAETHLTGGAGGVGRPPAIFNP